MASNGAFALGRIVRIRCDNVFPLLPHSGPGVGSTSTMAENNSALF